MTRHYETHLYTYAVALMQGDAIRPENLAGIRAKAVRHHSEGAALCVEANASHYVKTGQYGKPCLAYLKGLADAASDAFDLACKPYYADGRWGAYRAFECGDSVPATVEQALDAYHAATHAFYLARDSEGGFLGSRGA